MRCTIPLHNPVGRESSAATRRMSRTSARRRPILVWRPGSDGSVAGLPANDPDTRRDTTLTRCSPSPSAFLHEAECSGVTPVELPHGRAVVYSARCPGKTTPNEDSVLVMMTDAGVLVLAIADGCGGFAAGNMASRVAIEAVAERVNGAPAGEHLTATVLAAFTQANRAVLDLGVGAGTTLSILTVEGRTVQAYHAGDSPILVTGQRGRIKLHPVAHSPTAYAMQSGQITEAQAMVHVDRHIITNMVGSMDMHVEVSSPAQLAPRDTIVLASDGLSDNLRLSDIVEITRKGDLETSIETLVHRCDERMASASVSADRPGKPDDLSVILYRPLDHTK